MIVITIELNVLSENEDCVWLTDMSEGQLRGIRNANPTFSDSDIRDYVQDIWPDEFCFMRIEKQEGVTIYQALYQRYGHHIASVHSVNNLDLRDSKCQFNTF